MKSKEQLIHESILSNRDIKNLEKLKDDIIAKLPTSTITSQAGTFSFVTDNIDNIPSIKEINKQISQLIEEIKSHHNDNKRTTNN